MDNELFGYSPIAEREPIHWPGGARVAFYIGLNVEHYLLDQPSTSIFEGTASLVPDPLNYGWRDYGPRVAIWRLAESLDRQRPVFRGAKRRWPVPRQGATRAGLRPDHQGSARPALRRLSRQRPGHGPGVAPICHQPAIPAQIPRPSAGLRCQPPRGMADHQRRDRRALRP